MRAPEVSSLGLSDPPEAGLVCLSDVPLDVQSNPFADLPSTTVELAGEKSPGDLSVQFTMGVLTGQL